MRRMRRFIMNVEKNPWSIMDDEDWSSIFKVDDGEHRYRISIAVDYGSHETDLSRKLTGHHDVTRKNEVLILFIPLRNTSYCLTLLIGNHPIQFLDSFIATWFNSYLASMSLPFFLFYRLFSFNTLWIMKIDNYPSIFIRQRLYILYILRCAFYP